MPSSAQVNKYSVSQNMHENVRTIWLTFISVFIGVFIGASFPLYPRPKINTYLCSCSMNELHVRLPIDSQPIAPPEKCNQTVSNNVSESAVSLVPKGAEKLPPKIIEADSDLYLRRLWGDPREDLPIKPKYLVTFTVGYEHRDNINKCMQKFSENFTVVLFHYDGRASEWDEFDWSKKVVHVSARKQTKWWFAKRFMHPNVVAPYEYVFVWDEDLGLENFDPEEYIKIAKKHELEISQPGVVSDNVMWALTKKRENSEVHKSLEEKTGWCSGEKKWPPCAGFVEVMAPVFSRNAWRCVWSMLQNDLVHGWGLDFAFGKCVDAPNEQIGVVDAQWIRHLAYPSLGQQGESQNGDEPWRGLRDRCSLEWNMFKKRLAMAEKDVLNTKI